MEEKLISFKTAKLAREKGFNEYCSSYYDNNGILYTSRIHKKMGEYFAPTQSLFQKWLKERHNINIKPSKETLEIRLQEALKLIK